MFVERMHDFVEKSQLWLLLMLVLNHNMSEGPGPGPPAGGESRGKQVWSCQAQECWLSAWASARLSAEQWFRGLGLH